MGFITAIISGICMTFQGVFNTRASETAGLWETNVFVQGTALIVTLIIMLIFGKGDFKALKDVNKLYLTGGILGSVIIYTVMVSMAALSPALAVATILIAQLLSASLVDGFGLFGTDVIKFTWMKFGGLILMIGGLILFKIEK